MNPIHKELVILAVITMFVGQGMALYANPVISDYRSTEGFWDRHEDVDAQAEYEHYMMIQTAGITLVAFGIVMMCVMVTVIYIRHYQELPVHVKGRSRAPSTGPHPQIRICASCGKQIPHDSVMCPYCGVK
jgi:hypothetical protein